MNFNKCDIINSLKIIWIRIPFNETTCVVIIQGVQCLIFVLVRFGLSNKNYINFEYIDRSELKVIVRYHTQTHTHKFEWIIE